MQFTYSGLAAEARGAGQLDAYHRRECNPDAFPVGTVARAVYLQAYAEVTYVLPYTQTQQLALF